VLVDGRTSAQARAEMPTIVAELDRLLPDFVTQDPTMRLVLVRDKGNDLDGLVDRAWAYVDDNWFLPKTFTYCGEPEEDSGIAVPKRFHRMIARAAR
jgi:hypothetical protein